MIRLFFTVLLVTMSFSFEAFAQSDDGSGRRIYGGGANYSAKVYNSTGSYGTRGPLSLKQLLAGKSDAATGSSSSYYGGSNYRPFGIDNNSHSLSLSPSAIRDSRAKRDALARRMESDNLRNLQQTARADDLQNDTNGFLKTFQSKSGSNSTSGKRRSIYKKRNKGFEMPKKVFNSVY